MKVLFLALSCIIAGAKSQELFPVSIIHLNDMHARFDETNTASSTCKEGDSCIGGYARVVSKVKELLVTKSSKNPIYLNAADNFQGTLWYNIYRWNVTSYFLNLLPADAMTIGNHEFDHGIEGLVPFLETIKSPILISNIDDSLEPTFQNKYTKSMVMRKYGRPIGIVGVTTTFPSNWGKLRILPEVQAVKDEVAKLKDDGINIIIVLSHCGLEVDREIAKNGGDIDIIIGGHSHSFLYSGDNPPGTDRPVDTYPTVEIQENGREVLIVQASAYTKYLGDITLYFDDEGIVKRYEGAPIFLGNDVVPDPAILEELVPWKAGIDEIQNRVIGVTKIDLTTVKCYSQECVMGNLIADVCAAAFLDNKPDNQGWTGAAIGMSLPGGVRSGLLKGQIFYGDLVASTPFENLIYSLELQGKVVKELFEFSVADENSKTMPQVSGLKIVFDMKKEKNNRVVSIEVLCRICENNVPKYEPIDYEKFYRIAMPSYLAEGGDNFTMVPENARNLIYGPRDIDALTDYIAKYTPIIKPPLSGRITFV